MIEFTLKNGQVAKAINVRKISWLTDGRRTEYLGRGFGIIREDGKMLSRKGENPAHWDTKKIVETQLLPYCESFENYTWIAVTVKK